MTHPFDGSRQSALHRSPVLRSPRRITITISNALHQALVQRSNAEGRSMSNLAAYLLELSLDERPRPSVQPAA